MQICLQKQAAKIQDNLQNLIFFSEHEQQSRAGNISMIWIELNK